MNTPSKSQSVTSSSSSRQQAMTDFLHSFFGDTPFRIDSLAGDASFRRYHRIVLTDGSTKFAKTYMLMDAPPELESVDSFVHVATFMDDVVNVPSIVADNIPQGFLLLQDFGNVEFAHILRQANLLPDGQQQINDLYHWAMDSLLTLQTLPLEGDASQLPPYDAERLQSEMALFTEWFLPYLNVKLDDEAKELWQNLNQAVARQVTHQPQVVVHRDYHSRNLMQDQYYPKDLGIIDFQDAVIGAYTYDLVSLLRDAYVDWSDHKIDAWATYFYDKLPKSLQPSKDQFLLDMNVMGLQRHLKILGIFVRLAQRDGKMRYLSDIPKVWRDFMFELEWLGTNADQKVKSEGGGISEQADNLTNNQTQNVYASFYDWVQTHVTPQFNKVFG